MHKLCECGCGSPAPIAARTDLARGYVKGEPKRYIFGHRPGVSLVGRPRGDYNRRWHYFVGAPTGGPLLRIERKRKEKVRLRSESTGDVVWMDEGDLLTMLQRQAFALYTKYRPGGKLTRLDEHGRRVP